VLKRPTPKLFRIAGFACLTLSYIIKKNDNTAATVKRCPAEDILCHPPRDEG
jgi:hypothetical protein